MIGARMVGVVGFHRQPPMVGRHPHPQPQPQPHQCWNRQRHKTRAPAAAATPPPPRYDAQRSSTHAPVAARRHVGDALRLQCHSRTLLVASGITGKCAHHASRTRLASRSRSCIGQHPAQSTGCGPGRRSRIRFSCRAMAGSLHMARSTTITISGNPIQISDEQIFLATRDQTPGNPQTYAVLVNNVLWPPTQLIG
jgi:hypothetical protein